MSVHDLRRLLVLCAILQRILANGSTEDHAINWQPKNSKHASCPTCPKDCPDILSSPWYGKPVMDEPSRKRGDADEKSKSNDLWKWNKAPESLPYLMSSPHKQLSRQPVDYKLPKHTSAPTIASQNTHETRQNFDAAYFPNNRHHATNEGNPLKILELYNSAREQPRTEEKQQSSKVYHFKSSPPDMTQDGQKEFNKMMTELMADERGKEFSGPGHRNNGHTNVNEAEKVVTIALTDEELHSLLAEDAAGGDNRGMKYKSHQSQPFSLSQRYDPSSKRPVVVEEDMKVFIVDTDVPEADADRQNEFLRLQDGTSEEEKLNTRKEYARPRGRSNDQRLNSRTSDNRDEHSAMYSDTTNNANNRQFATLHKDASFANDKKLSSANRQSPLLNEEQGSVQSYFPEDSYDFLDDSAYFASRALYAKLKEGQVTRLTRPNMSQKTNPFDAQQMKEIGEFFAPMTVEKYVDEQNDHDIQDEAVSGKGTNTEDWKHQIAAQNPVENIYEYLDKQKLRSDQNDRESELNARHSYKTFIPEEPTAKLDTQDIYKEETNRLNETKPLANNTYYQSLNKDIYYNFRPQRASTNIHKEEIRYANFPQLMVDIEKRTIPQYKEGTRQNQQFQFAENGETAKLDENGNYNFRFGAANKKNGTEKSKNLNMNVSKRVESAENHLNIETDTPYVPEDSEIHKNAEMFMEMNTASSDQNHEEKMLSNFDPDLLDEIEEPMEPTEATWSADFMETSTKL